jgi:signal-transduction protein with cAMP-binding, CBS, and nucleotidyltransferase domain
MKCEDLMTVDLQWVSSRATVAQVATVMRDRSMGLLVVLDPTQNRMVGVVTDRDLAVRVCAENRPADKTLVGEVSTPEVVTCAATDKLEVAEAKMIEFEKSRIVVVNAAGRPVGVISLTDILARDRKGRAIKTARAVLAREAGGPHAPIESIKLTPSTPEDKIAALRPQTIHGGNWTGSISMFPS